VIGAQSVFFTTRASAGMLSPSASTSKSPGTTSAAGFHFLAATDHARVGRQQARERRHGLLGAIFPARMKSLR